MLSEKKALFKALALYVRVGLRRTSPKKCGKSNAQNNDWMTCADMLTITPVMKVVGSTHLNNIILKNIGILHWRPYGLQCSLWIIVQMTRDTFILVFGFMPCCFKAFMA